MSTRRKALVIDIFPYRVQADRAKQFFTVEKYFLGKGAKEIRGKFFQMMMKLSCYFPMSIFAEDEELDGIDEPTPEQLANLFGGKKYDVVFDLFMEDTKITAQSDDIYMTVFPGSEHSEDIIRQLASAEGLFVREAVQDNEKK